MTQPRLTLAMRPRVSVASTAGRTTIEHPWGSIGVTGPAWIARVLEALCEREMDTDGLLDLLVSEGVDDETAVAAALAELNEITRRLPMVIQRSVYLGEDELLRLVPVGWDAPPATAEVPEHAVVALDRAAYLRRLPGAPGLSLESPLAHHRAQLSGTLLSLLDELSTEGLDVDGGIEDGPRSAIGLLLSVGLLRRASELATDPADGWRFHDLVFHARSRQGRTDEAFGALSEEEATVVPPPPVAPRTATAVRRLAVPRFEAVVDADLRLTEAIEGRRSIREYATEPVTLEELGELLYRTARARGIYHVAFHEGYEGVDRPYPTGGMAGDLEVYVTAPHCRGLAPGAYFYDSVHHQLEEVASLEVAQPLLVAAQVATGLELEPQVLLTFTSRFARTSWKYGSIAYALTLKHVGVLMQTIYLVATSMGLAPCALGSGDADAAARVFGLRYTEESSVGEMLLGRPRAAEPRPTAFRDLIDATGAAEAAEG